MSYCLNPNCSRPTSNSMSVKFCTGCGAKLLLAERYRATKQIGQGGFGKTFLAVDEYKPSQPRCVIKQFSPLAQGTNNIGKASELFKVEAAQLDELGRKHPQIPELLAYFTQDNQQYLVQEFIDGQNLADEIKLNGTLTEEQIIALLNNLLPVLQFVHSQQVIHRDIKPENIIRRSDGELVLVDFGAAKTLKPTALSVTGTVIGTAGYASPEQAFGKASFASDIYSLGVTCLHLLTMIEPFDLYDITEGEWVWRYYLHTPVSNNFGQVLDKMVAGSVKRRYQSAGEVLQAVKRRYQSAGEVLQALNPHKIAPTIINPPQPASIPTIPSSYPDNLGSEVGVDYTKLSDLLAAQKWKEADRETYLVMLKVLGRKEADWIRVEELLKFPCTDLRIIDQLWVKYSNGRFGFSVQKKIYLEVGGLPDGKYHEKAWSKFLVRVGWIVKSHWILEYNETSDTIAPMGHLPCFGKCYRLGYIPAGDFLSYLPADEVLGSDNLSSDAGVDYTSLRYLLANGNWKGANYETYLVMLKVVGRKEGDWIRNEELLNFPCTDLRTIDNLWVKYSSRRFGFSVQKKIYLEVGGKPDGKYHEKAWNKFGDRVGWRKGWWIKEWITYGEETFDTSAPMGHLPSTFPLLARDRVGNRCSLLSHPDL